jgi:hypothetical protein
MKELRIDEIERPPWHFISYFFNQIWVMRFGSNIVWTWKEIWMWSGKEKDFPQRMFYAPHHPQTPGIYPHSSQWRGCFSFQLKKNSLAWRGNSFWFRLCGMHSMATLVACRCDPLTFRGSLDIKWSRKQLKREAMPGYRYYLTDK